MGEKKSDPRAWPFRPLTEAEHDRPDVAGGTATEARKKEEGKPTPPVTPVDPPPQAT
jgi:hypothetical protein